MYYTHILFDLDRTLFDFDAAEEMAFSAACDRFNMPFSSENFLLYHKINADQWKEYELGRIAQNELGIKRFEILLESLHLKRDALSINTYYKQQLSQKNPLLPDSLEICQTLSRYLKLYIITNGSPETQRGRLSNSPVTPYFTDIFISGEIGHQKPQKEFFDYVLSRINADKKQILVIGDNIASDIKGGQNAGLDTCWFCTPKQKNWDPFVIPTHIIHNLKDLIPLLLG